VSRWIRALDQNQDSLLSSILQVALAEDSIDITHARFLNFRRRTAPAARQSQVQSRARKGALPLKVQHQITCRRSRAD
jgi:hypothetical protein